MSGQFSPLSSREESVEREDLVAADTMIVRGGEPKEGGESEGGGDMKVGGEPVGGGDLGGESLLEVWPEGDEEVVPDDVGRHPTVEIVPEAGLAGPDETVTMEDVGEDEGSEVGKEHGHNGTAASDHIYAMNEDAGHDDDLDQSLRRLRHCLPTIEEIVGIRIPTIKHVPKSVRLEWTIEKLKLVVALARDMEEENNWKLYLMYAACTVKAAPRGNTSQVSTIRERIRRWKSGEAGLLWAEAVAGPAHGEPTRRRDNITMERQEELNGRRARNLVQEGQYSRAATALVSPGIAKSTAQVRRTMEAKHPPEVVHRPVRVLPAYQGTHSNLFSTEQVVKALKSFSPGTAPGPTGLRAEHLKLILGSGSPNTRNKAADGLRDLVNAMAAGGVPESIAPFLAGATLFAAKKKGGGVRPIAVGLVTRRLVSKCFAASTAEKAAEILSPLQVGVGIKRGCEALVHGARALFKDRKRGGLQIDFINAYNMADRQEALRQVEQHFPTMANWVQTCYGCHANLYLGDIIIPSQRGFHQGDPISGLLFSLVLHPVLEAIQEQVPDVHQAWYLDDGMMEGETEDLGKAAAIIDTMGPSRGLIMSTTLTVPEDAVSKTRVHLPRGVAWTEHPIGLGIVASTEEGFVFLGAPIGPPDFQKNHVREVISGVRDLVDSLPLVEDPHTEYVLIRSCFALPKIMYTLRTVDAQGMDEEWAEFDNILRDGLTRILGNPVTDMAWRQAQLPVTMGGLGLRTAIPHASGALVSSVVGCATLAQQFTRCDVDLQDLTLQTRDLAERMSTPVSDDQLIEMSQRAISLEVDLKLRAAVDSEAITDRDKARLRVLSAPHTGDWLNVVPLPILGLHLKPREFKFAVNYRLGMPLYQEEGVCPACGKAADEFGDHSVACAHTGERIARHNHLANMLFRVAQSANLAPTKEENALIPGTQGRPADVLIRAWGHGGKDMAYDVVVTSPLQKTLVKRAGREDGVATKKAFEDKLRKYGEACRVNGMEMSPMAVDTFGAWHPKSAMQLKRLAKALARQTGEDEGSAVSHTFQRMAVLLIRDNASMFLTRVPEVVEASTSGVL
jgi:hypothetical protein